MAVGIISLIGLWLVAGEIPDGAAADRINYILLAMMFFGLAACGVGWFLSGYKIVAVSLLATRVALIVIGGAILDRSLTVACDSPCGSTWSDAVFVPVTVLGLVLCGASLLMPALSTAILIVALRNPRWAGVPM